MFILFWPIRRRLREREVCLLRPLARVCCEIVLAVGPMVCVCLGLVWCGCGTCVGLGSQAFGWWAYSLPLGLFLSIFF